MSNYRLQGTVHNIINMGNRDRREKKDDSNQKDEEGNKTDMDQCRLIVKINDLLTYIQHYMKKSSIENLRKAVLRFFPEEEITEAKTVLWDASGAGGPLGKMPIRTKSSARLAHEADLMDILTAMQKLDTEQLLVNVCFAHYNLDNVPKYAPEEADTSVYAAQISQHEQRLAALERQEDEQKSEMASIRLMIQELTNKQNENYSDVLKTNLLDQTQFCRTSEAGRGQNGAFGPMQPTAKVRVENEKPERLSDWPRLPNSSSGPLKQVVHVSSDGKGDVGGMNAGSYQVDSDGFQVPREDRRRQRRRVIRENCVFGKREGTALKSGPKYSDLFIFRIHCDVQTQELREFIADEGIDIQDIVQVSKDGSRMKSYKLTVETKFKDQLLSEDMWPEGIGCREYVEFRRFSGGNLVRS